ncbi:MAG: phytoene/squalene synthase family protein [Salinibacter sp.]
MLWRRLSEVHTEYTLDAGPLYELIDGAVWDLEDRPIETLDDLVDYSNLVGGSVGAMMLPFLAGSDRHDTLEPAARELGIAMQITNIVRDVGEDITDLGRVYLPTEWLDEHDVAREDLADGRVVEGYPFLLERVMTAAEERYRNSFSGVAALPFRKRVGIRAAARMYREIMNEVRRNEYDNLTQRAYVSTRRKLLLVALDNYDWRKARLQA